jgi:hypothetical protein
MDTISARDVSEAISVLDGKNVENRLRGQNAGKLAAKEVIAQRSRGQGRARREEGTHGRFREHKTGVGRRETGEQWEETRKWGGTV